MKINFESELMENHKHAMVMAPDLAFDVLQTRDGNSLFFSIGTDKIFYLTCEVTQTSTGWNKLDLSSALSSQHGNSPVAAKTFSIAQNAQTLAIDLALVVTVGGADFLYLSLGNANTDASWANGVTWTAVPLDAPNINTTNPLAIADVYLMNIPAGDGSAVENIFVDILRTPGDPLKLLDRYYITPGQSPQWNHHSLPADMSAGSISSCLGQRANDPIPGIYTFGTIGNEQELIFTTQYNYFRPNVAPPVARLTLPSGASAIVSVINSNGASNLFVTGTNGLYLFTPDNQSDKATPVQIVSSPLIAGANSLSAATMSNRTAVWGIDPQGNLFYTACPAGQEANPSAWSPVVPLLPSVEGVAFFLNLNAGNNVLFAHVDNQNLIQLTQDPVTSEWHQRSILLPSTSMDDVVAYKTYTTHIRVTDDNGIGVPNTNVQITATSPVSVYIENVYYRLSSTVPVNIITDPTGALNVVQETDSISGVYFRVALTNHPDVVAEVNPMSKGLAILKTIQTGADLGKVQVTNADGTQHSLVPSDVSDDDKENAAQLMKKFVQAAASLPQDGSVQKTSATSATATPHYWGGSFANGTVTYYEGDAAVQLIKPHQAKSEATAGTTGQRLTDSSIEMAFGDLFRWIKHISEEAIHFVVQEVENVYYFICQIGGEIYHAVLNCVNAVVHGIEFVFNKIKTFFNDLIQWLGFLFQWHDIVRTHNVLKNIFNQYMRKVCASLDTLEDELKNGFTYAVQAIDAWAGIPDNIPPDLAGSTVGSISSSNTTDIGQNSPQSNYGVNQFKGNVKNSNTSYALRLPGGDDITSALDILEGTLNDEMEVLEKAFNSLMDDVIKQIQSLTLEQILKKIVAIITDALLETIENFLLHAIKFIKLMIQGVVDGLNAPIDIPVISWLYKQISGGNELTAIDLACLIAAIPVTICYKIMTDRTPFPDNARTNALIHATDFAALRKIFNPVRGSAMVGDPNNQDDIVTLSGDICALIGGIVLTLIGWLKKGMEDADIPPTGPLGVLWIANSLAYICYAAPSFFAEFIAPIETDDSTHQYWWAPALNAVVTDLAIAKVMVDMGFGLNKLSSGTGTTVERWEKISPWADLVINLAWQIPTTLAYLDNPNPDSTQQKINILNLSGGTCFDATGVLSPALANVKDPVAWAALYVIIGFLNITYGALSVAAGAINFRYVPPKTA